MSKLASEIISEQDVSFRNLSTKRALWDETEQLFHGQLRDAISSGAKSKVFDHKLSTLILERSYRVMAQLQTGKVIGIGKNDIGDAKLKNLLLEKYVIPNANAQFDFLTKMRMMDMYSNIYGNFFSLTDHDVKPNGYVGPDVYLLNIRDVFPQTGPISLEDSDKIIIRTWRPLTYFEGLSKQDGFKNIPKIIAKLKDKAGSKQTRDSDSKSKREEVEYPDNSEAKDGFFEILTRYERDRWVDVCVDADLEFRDKPNPHDNGELPIDCKYSIPLLDDFMGIGDMERGAPMQKTTNAVWNLYLDAVKMSIFPPVLLNKDNIASASSIQWKAAAKWLGRNNINNFAQPMNLTPRGIDSFNNVYQVATSSILNLFGTTNTAVTAQTDPGMGKTPQALKYQQARENTRDNADRFFMEQYLTKISKKMVNLLNKKQSGDIAIRMFSEEIDLIAKDYPEVKEMYDDKTGELSVKKGSENLLYDYEIVSGSTFALDQQAQQENIQMMLNLYQQSQTPQGNKLVDDLRAGGYDFNFGELFKRLISKGGIEDWDKILTELSEDEKADMVLQKDAQKFQQILQQAAGGLGQVPPQPNEQPNDQNQRTGNPT